MALPFELDVSFTLEGIGWALRQKTPKKRVPLGFWSQLWKGAEIRDTPIVQQLLPVYTLQVEPLPMSSQLQ